MMKYENDDILFAKELLDKIVDKEEKVAIRSVDKIPYTTVNGIFDDKGSEDINWWTNGFYPGMMWLLYSYKPIEIFKKVAEAIEDKLDANLMDYMGMDHDSGFKWLLSSGANYKLTGNLKARNRAMLAAGNLAGRINLKAGLIRAWNDRKRGETQGWAIIDCLMNLPLLYWASNDNEDPRFEQIARLHADKAMEYFVREDGSVKHIIVFDPNTGKYIKSLAGQGKCHGSSWSRGQSWGLYGFGLSYRYTKDEKYLDAARKIGEYVLKNIPENGLIPTDFYQEEYLDWKDSCAAAILANGYLELYEHTEEKKYYQIAIKLIKALINNSFSLDEDIDYLLTDCSASYDEKEHNYSIIYADFFLVEALLRLSGKENFIW